MSPRNPHYELSSLAETDHDEILLYSLITWGESQSKEVEATINRALDAIANFPFSGGSRPTLGPGVRGRVIGSHIAYYKVMDEKVVVLRILHERRDAKTLLDG